MPTLKTRSAPKSTPARKRAQRGPVTPETARSGKGPASADVVNAVIKKVDAAEGSTTSLQSLKSPVEALAVPKVFFALAVDAGVFLLGALPEAAPKIAGLGFYPEGGMALMLCCEPAQGGILLVDSVPYVAPAAGEAEAVMREHKFLAFLPMPTKLLASATPLFGAVQEDGVRTQFPIEVKPLPTLEGALRDSVMREYKHLFAPAVSALLPAKHPLRASRKPETGDAAAPSAQTGLVKAAPTGSPAAAAASSKAAAPLTKAAVVQQGFFDEIVDGRAEGWAFDPANPKQRLVVEILEGDRVVARGVADRFRDDLLNAGIGDGRHCYKLPVSYALRDGHAHRLTARLAQTRQALQIKGGGNHHLFEHAPVDLREFDFLPADETLRIATAIAAGLDSLEEKKLFVYAFGNAGLALEMRELAEAARGLLDLIYKYGEHPLLFCKLAECHLLGSRTADALRVYQEVVGKSPEFGWAWLGLGCAHRLLGQPEPALKAYEKAASLLPQTPAVVTRLRVAICSARLETAKAALAQGKSKDAVLILKQHLASYPADESAWSLLEEALRPPQESLLSRADSFEALANFMVMKELLDMSLDLAQPPAGGRK